MAESDGASSAPVEAKVEGTTSIAKFRNKLPRRQWSLIGITAALNVLLWSAFSSLVTSLYTIGADPNDTSNVAAEVLTIISALSSIAYVILHTIFSLKQKIWRHQQSHPSKLKKTSYVAVRFVVTLCTLWLLTSGWNMILVARQPVCRSRQPGLEGWQFGSPCVAGRVGMAFSLIALLTSFALFGVHACVHRPFEAHVFKHGYREALRDISTPPDSRRPSPTRNTSMTSEVYRPRISASTHRSMRSMRSNISNGDVETLDLNYGSPPSTIYAPSPQRSLGFGIFTSQAQPPPLPPAFIPSRKSSLDFSPPIFQPSASHHHLPPPPRMSALVAPSGFVPLSIPVVYPASAWRAVHPSYPSPLGSSAASRSHPHLPNTASGTNFSYRNRYSRSSVSLSKPHRLSTATPAGSTTLSSRSASTSPGDEGRSTPSDSDRRANASEIAYAILNGTPIPGSKESTQYYQQQQQQLQLREQKNRGAAIQGHTRHSSAPDTTCGAGQPAVRMAKGWKPRLQTQTSRTSINSGEASGTKMMRSASAELLGRFGRFGTESDSGSSPEDNVSLKRELDRQIEGRLGYPTSKSLPPVKKQTSRSSLRFEESVTSSASSSSSMTVVPGYPVGSRLSRMPGVPSVRKRSDDAVSGHGEDTQAGAASRRSTMVFDEVKNKPLPKIASL